MIPLIPLWLVIVVLAFPLVWAGLMLWSWNDADPSWITQ
jgi:hypothetical protein